MGKKFILILSVFIMIGLVSCSNTNNETNELVIYATRHRKLFFNTVDRVQGWADTSLTQEGIEVVEFLGTGLKEDSIDFVNVYTSDLGRSRETAHVILNKMDKKE